jgi:imidazolonepropionase-like amidohydrolase
MKKKLILCALLVLSLNVFSQKTVLIAKKLIDGTGKVISNPAIIINDNKIIGIEDKENLHLNKYGNGFTIIDLGEYTLLPGLIDAHVHPDNSSDDYQVGHLRASSAAKTLTGLKAVQDLLSAGWTALRVAGDEEVGYANLEIRNAINKGVFVGPHIYGAGHYLSVTGGGGDINFISYEQKIIPDGLIVDGPEEVRKAVRT